MSKTANPALVLNFTAPVNPSIATEPGKLHMHFSHEALESPASPVLTFDSKTIPSASYEQSNGAADITVNGTAPLFATFSSDRKTITITAPRKPRHKHNPHQQHPALRLQVPHLQGYLRRAAFFQVLQQAVHPDNESILPSSTPAMEAMIAAPLSAINSRKKTSLWPSPGNYDNNWRVEESSPSFCAMATSISASTSVPARQIPRTPPSTSAFTRLRRARAFASTPR